MLTRIEPHHALDLILTNTTLRPCSQLSPAEAVGRSLGQTIFADRDAPPFDRAERDGFAVRLDDAGAVVHEVGEVAAGSSSALSVEPGRCVAVMTGAPCPPGTEAVVAVERTSSAGGRVKLPQRIEPGQQITRRGRSGKRATWCCPRPAWSPRWVWPCSPRWGGAWSRRWTCPPWR